MFGWEHVYMKDVGKAAIIIFSVPICGEHICATNNASYTLFHLIKHPVPLEKVGVSPAFYLWGMKSREVMELMQCHTASQWHNHHLTLYLRLTLSTLTPALLQHIFSKLTSAKILLTHFPIKIISSWRKKQEGWLNPMLIYFGRLFTRLFKELSDSANFN